LQQHQQYHKQHASQAPALSPASLNYIRNVTQHQTLASQYERGGQRSTVSSPSQRFHHHGLSTPPISPTASSSGMGGSFQAVSPSRPEARVPQSLPPPTPNYHHHYHHPLHNPSVRSSPSSHSRERLFSSTTLCFCGRDPCECAASPQSISHFLSHETPPHSPSVRVLAGSSGGPGGFSLGHNSPLRNRRAEQQRPDSVKALGRNHAEMQRLETQWVEKAEGSMERMHLSDLLKMRDSRRARQDLLHAAGSAGANHQQLNALSSYQFTTPAQGRATPDANTAGRAGGKRKKGKLRKREAPVLKRATTASKIEKAAIAAAALVGPVNLTSIPGVTSPKPQVSEAAKTQQRAYKLQNKQLGEERGGERQRRIVANFEASQVQTAREKRNPYNATVMAAKAALEYAPPMTGTLTRSQSELSGPVLRRKFAASYAHKKRNRGAKDKSK
jgi:hypothetical protein